MDKLLSVMFFLAEVELRTQASKLHVTSNKKVGEAMLDEANAINAFLLSTYQELHQYPELSHREVQTSRRVADWLKDMGIEVMTVLEDMVLWVSCVVLKETTHCPARRYGCFTHPRGYWQPVRFKECGIYACLWT